MEKKTHCEIADAASLKEKENFILRRKIQDLENTICFQEDELKQRDELIKELKSQLDWLENQMPLTGD